jgi:hypothetical protein
MRHLVLLSCLILFSCGNQTSSAPAINDSSISVTTTEPTLEEKQNQSRFIVDSYEDSMEIPHSKISVEYNESRTYLEEIPGIAEIQEGGNKEMDIPMDAISSCGCWYAGGGDYYYIPRSPKGITVFHGWLDEMQEDDGYHWEVMKTIE